MYTAILLISSSGEQCRSAFDSLSKSGRGKEENLFKYCWVRGLFYTSTKTREKEGQSLGGYPFHKRFLSHDKLGTCG